jgi:nucleosome binding factor SPN SPT16 subunit
VAASRETRQEMQARLLREAEEARLAATEAATVANRKKRRARSKKSAAAPKKTVALPKLLRPLRLRPSWKKRPRLLKPRLRLPLPWQAGGRCRSCASGPGEGRSAQGCSG